MKTMALGLMSGTSADGISSVLASFENKKFSIVGSHDKAYPPATVQKIRKGSALSAKEISELNVEVGELFAKTANELLKKIKVKPSRVACIGSHGQTLCHGPHDAHPNTLQIGDPFVIAERTGITTVAHFRERDLAVGGEGAPLIPFFDQYYFGNSRPKAFQNIGGISNVTVVGKGKEPLAFDTGPGNTLLDTAVRLITAGKENYDAGGKRAKRGMILTEIVSRMMETEFFKKYPPKSTGLELFNEDFIRQHFGSKLETQPDDVLATLVQLTAVSIQESYRNFIFKKFPIGEIYISGGGIYNKTLIRKLECLFAPIPVHSILDLGIPPQAKEPLAFAFFGLRRLQGKINHSPQGTGASKALSLGSIVYA